MVDKFMCIRCGRSHQEGSQAYRFHQGLDPARFNLCAKRLACGVALKDAGRKKMPMNRARYYEINESFKDLGFREAFPSKNLKGQLQDWVDQNVIGHTRSGGRDKYEFLANNTYDTPLGYTAKSFQLKMTRAHSSFEDYNLR